MNFIRLAVPVACFVPAACNEFPSAGDFRDLNKNLRLDVYEDVIRR